jgi:hypothetical protein
MKTPIALLVLTLLSFFYAWILHIVLSVILFSSLVLLLRLYLSIKNGLLTFYKPDMNEMIVILIQYTFSIIIIVYMNNYVIPIFFLCLSTSILFYPPTRVGYICIYTKRTYAEIIAKFAKPLLKTKMNNQSKYFIIKLAILAWKASLKNQNIDRKKFTRKIKKIAPHLDFEYKKEAVQMLIKRKKRHYGKYNFIPIMHTKHGTELRIVATQPLD